MKAKVKLRGISDLFLVHNRDIVNRIDDSVVRTIGEQKIFLRRARGYSPYYFKESNFTKSILAVGANMKNTFAMSQEGNIFSSPHIGDLDNIYSLNVFKDNISTAQSIYSSSPSLMACDLHPNYMSTKYAIENNNKTISIQHHHAHIAAVMLEKKVSGSVLGVSFDGSGFGLDNTIWGGEFLIADYKQFNRVATIDLFPLPGGEKAIKEPWRIAIGMLAKLSDQIENDFAYLESIKKFTFSDIKLLLNMIESNINTPMTSSIGRLFDAVSAIIGVRERVEFEGQAAMELEFLAEKNYTQDLYEFDVVQKKDNKDLMIIGWKILLKQILIDLRNDIDLSIIARKFHNTIVEIIIFVAKKIGIKSIVLSGGCFQNKILLKNSILKLEKQGFLVYWPEEIPINDGGISLGQLVIANANL